MTSILKLDHIQVIYDQSILAVKDVIFYYSSNLQLRNHEFLYLALWHIYEKILQ